MRVFVDTSALLAVLDADDAAHPRAARWWAESSLHHDLLTHNYVVVETIALAQARLGQEALRDLRDAFLPMVDIRFVDRELHDEAFVAVLASGRRAVSFVDHASFALMRRELLGHAFAFDAHFADEGFDLVA